MKQSIIQFDESVIYITMNTAIPGNIRSLHKTHSELILSYINQITYTNKYQSTNFYLEDYT